METMVTFWNTTPEQRYLQVHAGKTELVAIVSARIRLSKETNRNFSNTGTHARDSIFTDVQQMYLNHLTCDVLLSLSNTPPPGEGGVSEISGLEALKREISGPVVLCPNAL